MWRLGVPLLTDHLPRHLRNYDSYEVLRTHRFARGQQSTGTTHQAFTELWLCRQGHGSVVLGQQWSRPFAVRPGSAVLIETGVYYLISNDGDRDLVFDVVGPRRRAID